MELATVTDSMLSDNIIVLKSLHKVRKFKIQATQDRNGRWLGGVKNVDSNGDMILSDKDDKSLFYLSIDDIIEVYDGMELNLSDQRDKTIWEMIQHSPVIASSREEADRSEFKEFFVFKPGFEAKKRVSTAKTKHEAESFIFAESPEGLYKICRILGHDMTSAGFSEVQEYLLSIAHETPEVIINAFKNPAMKTKLFLLDAIEKKVISYKNGVYTYEGGETIQILGISENAVIEYLNAVENKKITDLIKAEVYPNYAKKSK